MPDRILSHKIQVGKKVCGTTAEMILTLEKFKCKYIPNIGRILAKTIGYIKCFSGLE